MCSWTLASASKPPSAMADRPAKLARLNQLRCRVPFVSQSALSTILRLARDDELPAACTRQDVRDSRDTSVQTMTPYGPLHQRITVPGDIDLEIQHPMAMLHHCCANSAALSKLVMNTAAARPPTLTNPWHIVIYADEILPGNQLAYKHNRKFWGVYWSILEFGAAALSDEDRGETGNKQHVNLLHPYLPLP